MRRKSKKEKGKSEKEKVKSKRDVQNLLPLTQKVRGQVGVMTDVNNLSAHLPTAPSVIAIDIILFTLRSDFFNFKIKKDRDLY